MNSKRKKSLFVILAGLAVVVGLVAAIYLLLGDAQKSVPKIKLSYFSRADEIAASITKRLAQETEQTRTFWIGIEPEKSEQLEVALALKKRIEQVSPHPSSSAVADSAASASEGSRSVVKKWLNSTDSSGSGDSDVKPSEIDSVMAQQMLPPLPWQEVILDSELALKPEWIARFQPTKIISVKENIAKLAEILSAIEHSGQRYLLLTAAIYSSPQIKKNQIHQIKEMKPIQPMTFSLAYFPIRADLEKNMIFQCSTEDHSGVADWGCAVLNKSRFLRRKVKSDTTSKAASDTKLWVGAMDLVGEKDYMVLIYKWE